MKKFIDVGEGSWISKEWIPLGVSTNIKDMQGICIFTGDRVEVSGCMGGLAMVGKTKKGFVLFIGYEGISASWDLTEEVVKKRNIRV